MKIKVLFLLLSLGIVSASELTAPSFQLMNQNGENIELDSSKEKIILEWTNMIARLFKDTMKHPTCKTYKKNILKKV